MKGDGYVYGLDGGIPSIHRYTLSTIPQAHQTVYIKYVQFFPCQSHLNKAVWFFLIEVSTENVLSLFPGTKEKLFITFSSAISA